MPAFKCIHVHVGIKITCHFAFQKKKGFECNKSFMKMKVELSWNLLASFVNIFKQNISYLVPFTYMILVSASPLFSRWQMLSLCCRNGWWEETWVLQLCNTKLKVKNAVLVFGKGGKTEIMERWWIWQKYCNSDKGALEGMKLNKCRYTYMYTIQICAYMHVYITEKRGARKGKITKKEKKVKGGKERKRREKESLKIGQGRCIYFFEISGWQKAQNNFQ